MSFETQLCEGCVFEQLHRVPFPLGPVWRARVPLELIYADLCGRMKTPS